MVAATSAFRYRRIRRYFVPDDLAIHRDPEGIPSGSGCLDFASLHARATGHFVSVDESSSGCIGQDSAGRSQPNWFLFEPSERQLRFHFPPPEGPQGPAESSQPN